MVENQEYLFEKVSLKSKSLFTFLDMCWSTLLWKIWNMVVIEENKYFYVLIQLIIKKDKF